MVRWMLVQRSAKTTWRGLVARLHVVEIERCGPGRGLPLATPAAEADYWHPLADLYYLHTRHAVVRIGVEDPV